MFTTQVSAILACCKLKNASRFHETKFVRKVVHCTNHLCSESIYFIHIHNTCSKIDMSHRTYRNYINSNSVTF
jgi:hypothetical protein